MIGGRLYEACDRFSGSTWLPVGKRRVAWAARGRVASLTSTFLMGARSDSRLTITMSASDSFATDDGGGGECRLGASPWPVGGQACHSRQAGQGKRGRLEEAADGCQSGLRPVLTVSLAAICGPMTLG